MHETAYCQVCLMQDACKKGIDPLLRSILYMDCKFQYLRESPPKYCPLVLFQEMREFSASVVTFAPQTGHVWSGYSVNMLTSLYYWLKEEHCYESRKDPKGEGQEILQDKS